MKENKAKILAKAIFDLASDTKHSKQLVANFILYLNKRRLNYLLPKVLLELEELYNTEKGIVSVAISSRHQLTDKLEEQLVRFLEKKLNKKIKVNKMINESLLGGVVLRYQDKIIDLSLQQQINNLHKQLSN